VNYKRSSGLPPAVGKARLAKKWQNHWPCEHYVSTMSVPAAPCRNVLIFNKLQHHTSINATPRLGRPIRLRAWRFCQKLFFSLDWIGRGGGHEHAENYQADLVPQTLLLLELATSLTWQ
jgi:hypothetical protein